MKTWTICYRTKTPVVYNKGTQWETSSNEFLFKLAGKDKELAEGRCKEYNEMLKVNGTKVDGLNFDEVAEFFLVEQEVMH